MKKQGYTLAEVMITLGIIGVLAAIMMPLVNKLRPDSTKVAYLNTYDSLVTILDSVVNNESIYPTISGGRSFTKQPLLNTAAVEIGNTEIKAGANKLCRVLSESLKSNARNRDFSVKNACSDDLVYDTLNANTDFARDFTTKNGTQVMVKRINTTNSSQPYYRTDIYVDLDFNGNNCIYDADKCPNPDRFKFFVGVDGKIVPADPMGKYYLETRTNLKAQKDIEIDDSEITFPQDMQVAGKLDITDIPSDLGSNVTTESDIITDIKNPNEQKQKTEDDLTLPNKRPSFLPTGEDFQ